MKKLLATVAWLGVVTTGCDELQLYPSDGGVPVPTPDDDGGGVPLEDGGPAPEDSGAAPVDSGPAPEDSGPAPVDSGPAPVDSGPAPVDSGPPPGTDVDISGWVTIAAGTFTMGSPGSDPCRNANETEHEVTLTRGFLIDPYETTRGDFSTRMGYDPSADSASNTCTDEKCPINDVNWHMAAAYCNALSAQEGLSSCYDCSGAGEDVTCSVKAAYLGSGTVYDCPGIRLPTDAEWEYAYRAGTTTSLYNGDLPTAECQDTSALAGAIGWYIRNNSDGRAPVGGKTGNAWGLFDMAGNVSELVNDFYLADLGTAAATDPVVDVRPASESTDRSLIRGGSFAHHAENLRGPFRQAQTMANSGTGIGFRCVQTAE